MRSAMCNQLSSFNARKLIGITYTPDGSLYHGNCTQGTFSDTRDQESKVVLVGDYLPLFDVCHSCCDI